MSEEKDMFSPTRIQVIREVWAVLKDSKDITEAKDKYKALITNLVLGEE